MAKGQKRSNKEVKKPKQDKSKAQPATTVSGQLGEPQQGTKRPKK
jgi:hypothetical protein